MSQELQVRIADLCALVEDQNKATILFPECRVPQKAIAADPNPEHRLGIRIPAHQTKNPFQFPSAWKEDVREVKSLQNRLATSAPNHHFVWFPLDRDLRIVSEERELLGSVDLAPIKPFLTSFRQIYPEAHKQKHTRVDRAFLLPQTSSTIVRQHLDGRLFIGSGRLEPSEAKTTLKHWDNSYDEGNRVSPAKPQLTEEIIWKPELKKPVLQAKAFKEASWQTVLHLERVQQLEIFNAPAAAFLDLESWYKAVDEEPGLIGPGSSELKRSKHFQILAHLCEARPTARDIRLPYFTEPPMGSITHPVACPPGFFSDDC